MRWSPFQPILNTLRVSYLELAIMPKTEVCIVICFVRNAFIMAFCLSFQCQIVSIRLIIDLRYAHERQSEIKMKVIFACKFDAPSSSVSNYVVTI